MSRVFCEALRSSLTLYPTVSPTFSPRSCRQMSSQPALDLCLLPHTLWTALWWSVQESLAPCKPIARACCEAASNWTGNRKHGPQAPLQWVCMFHLCYTCRQTHGRHPPRLCADDVAVCTLPISDGSFQDVLRHLSTLTTPCREMQQLKVVFAIATLSLAVHG